MSTATTKKRGKRKAKAKAKPASSRPSRVEFAEVDGGRRKQDGTDATLYARIEERDGKTSVSLGSDYNKLQIRCSLDALRKIVEQASR